MTTIKLKTIDENLEFTSSPPVYSGDVNTISIQFEFDEFWDGFVKTAVFYRDISKPYQVVLNDDTCYIPHEVMKTAGRIFLGVFGVKEDKVKTSEVVFYDVGTGVMTYGSIPEPSDELWQQILSELNVIRGLATEIKDNEAQFIKNQTQAFTQLKNDTEQKISNFTQTATNELNTFKQNITQDNNEFKQDTSERFDNYYAELKAISANFMSVEDVDEICGGEYDPIFDDYNTESISLEELQKILN